MTTDRVVLELCMRNSIGSRYCEPAVKEIATVTREEADALLARPMANGYFWREQPADRTGNV